MEQALAAVELPLTLNWSQPGRVFRLSDRSDRARVYELVLREGSEADVLAYIDGALLVDLWDELVLAPGGARGVVAADRTGPSLSRCTGRGVVDGTDGGRLTAFQVQVAQLFFGLPASEGFCWLGEERCSRRV